MHKPNLLPRTDADPRVDRGFVMHIDLRRLHLCSPRPGATLLEHTRTRYAEHLRRTQ